MKIGDCDLGVVPGSLPENVELRAMVATSGDARVTFAGQYVVITVLVTREDADGLLAVTCLTWAEGASQSLMPLQMQLSVGFVELLRSIIKHRSEF